MFDFLREITSPKNAALLILVAVCSTILGAPARAEGTFQVGLNQPFVETNATAPGAASSRDILVDIVSAGEVINISACGATDTNTLAFVIETPAGAILPTYTPTALAGKILCANPMSAPITTPYRYTTTAAGRYKVRLINVTAANFNRFDITVTANASINPDPTNATGIKGRVSSLSWQYNTGSFAQTSATNADYYVLTPGGYPGTNYVWQLDLNALAGNVYSISANNKGVEAPRSGFSTDVAGNSVVPQFQSYINFPAIAGPPPASAPAVTGFRFIDSAGQDYAISPGNTAGVQDSGFFQFTVPVDNATYSISIDVNKNGIFGDAGDVRLTGNVINGFNSILWDGRNNSGVILPIDSYQARAEVRLGEFHFIANDVETSGGTQNGLTVYEATSPSTLVPTRVYWDDITVLGVVAGGTANTPLGAVSGTAAGYHTWGTFDAGGGGFGNNRFVDTFAFGATTQASLFVAIVGTDAPLTGSDGAVTITPTSKPGDALVLSVTDADLNSLSGIIETVLVSVRNNVTGEMESVTLTETGANTGIFTGSVVTTFGAVAGPNNNGVLSTQASDTVTVTYNDALTAAGTAVARTADDVVSGGVTGTVSITPTASAGDTVSVGVTDTDLNTNALAVETVIVTVVNSVTGEAEMVTLTETGANTGVFTGNLATTAGLVAGTNNNGTINVKAADTLVVTYADARAANGGPAAPTATNTINSYNPLVATDDTIVGVDATLGATNLVNAFNGDLVNLLPATSANAVLSIASGSSVPPGLTFNIATGEVGVVAGTTAATYSFNYQICEAANLLNCKTAVISVTVLIPVAPIAASNDTATGVDGVAGAANILNAFAGDLVNGVAATSANGVVSVATGFTVPAGLTFDTATGNISVIAGTAPGAYSFDYQLCEAANPANCDTATISVTVAVPPVIIVATPDSVTGVDGVAGAANVANAFTGDTVGGAAATTVNSVLSVAAGFTVPAGLTFDTATGNISVVAGTSAGTYSFDYEICELGNPANCQTATISVTVGIAPSAIVTTDDTASGVNGANGAADVVNIFDGDTVGGTAASNANSIISVALGFNVPAGLIFDPVTGNVSVDAGTAAGTYSFDYQICETAVPANCETASVLVTVTAAPLVAVSDSANGVNGASGASNVANAFTGDTINGAAATTANTTLSVATGSSVPSGVIFDTVSGNVSVAAGTPAGTYSFDYQICEALNPSNCQVSTISVTVAPSAVVAVADSVAGINGANGTANALNVLAGDTVNGDTATTGNSILSVATGSSVPAGLTFDTATGIVAVSAGTPAGTYSFEYQICEALNPANCQIATISVTVDAAPLAATSDSAAGINGATGAGNVVSAFTGDTINSAAATAANTTLTVATGSSVPAGLTFDTATGNVSVAVGTTAGTYTFDYQICEALNPTNCRTATISIVVDASVLVVANVNATGVIGATGAADVVNVLSASAVNGAAANTGNAIITVATGSSVPAGLVFNTATGNVSVAAGTAAGTYSFNFQICEALNPANCRTATVSVVVDAAALIATPDSVAAINGASGASDVLNVFTGDTLNGAAANAANTTLAIAAGSTVPSGLTFDTATGNVSVAAGTPAGSYSFDYRICEILNPLNCQMATVSVTVDASVVVATADAASAVNGASGAANVVNVLTGDTVNSTAATPSNVTLSVAAGSIVPAGLLFDAATGNVSVTAGTPAGSYSFNYSVCETLNPANCQVATVSISVGVSLVTAANISVTGISGAFGAADVANVLAGNTVNGGAATTSNAIISVASGSSVPVGLTFDVVTGNVSVASGTPAGVYSFNYQICEALNPANCQTATVSVTVDPSAIVATADSASGINGASGANNVVSAFAGDTINGVAASSSNAVLSVAPGSSLPPGLSFDTLTGQVAVAAGTPSGTYSFDYQICELLNPGNCRTSTISITANASAITATADSVSAINGASGAANVANVFAGDTVNGAAASAANAVLSVATGSAIPVGLTFDLATGNVSVVAGTPAGTYSFDYQICEILNPANCRAATVVVGVDVSAVVATNDTVSAINGANGAANAANVFTGDTVNSVAASATNAILSVASGSNVPAGLVFDIASGIVGVSAGTPAATYSFDYEICEALNPANCQTATVSVVVVPSALVVANVSGAGVNGATGAADVANVLNGSTVNGAAANTGNAIIAVAAGSSVPAGLVFDTATGNISVTAGAAAGTYSFNFQICEALNPANCQIATASITVIAAPLVATADTVTGVNGASGASNVANAFTGDTINGAAATTANTTLSVATGSSVPSGVIFDTVSGNVSVAAGTPAGTYSFDYQICEALNPSNCQVSTISVTVAPSAVVAVADSVAGINGANGTANALNVLAGDTVNGDTATTGNSILSVATGSSVPAGLTFDTATGIVAVSAGTPAGTYSFEYQICEALNPANCQTATTSVTTLASPLSVNGSIVVGINGANGAPDAANILTGNSINGQPATPSNAILSIAPGASIPAGFSLDNATGRVSIAAGTPAGSYVLTYQICEALNPANCSTASINFIVDAAPLLAANDSIGGVNGTSGASNVLNILVGDSLNGAPANTADVAISLAPGSTVPSALMFDTATGNVSVAARTPAGTYVFDYQICELLNPTNCRTAKVSITVDAAALVASPDSVTGINGASGASNVVNAFTGDTINGLPVSAANAILTVAPGSSIPAGLTFDMSTGSVNVAPGTPVGTYTFNYQICEILNPGNCQIAAISVWVDASPVVAVSDTVSGINGASGAANVLNAFAGDTVNGAAASPANSVLSIAAGSALPTGLVVDLLTGNVGVTAGTAAGTYSFDYKICETLNPANCKTATISVTVVAPPLVAASDSVTGINGASGASNVVNAFNGDTVNGVAATTANSILRVATGSAVPVGLIFVSATGNVSVAAGTPAGTYSFEYQICELLNPTNCRTATIRVTVDVSAIIATADVAGPINGASGATNVLNVFAQDTVNGVGATTVNARLAIAPGSAIPVGLRFDVATGNVSVDAGTAAGTYIFEYQLCEILNPANCATTTATVTVVAAPLNAVADTVTGINGASGAGNVVNAFTGDTVNGAAATPANSVLSVAAGSSVPAGLTFDVATGNVSVAGGTPAGTYVFDYQICELLNPTNCRVATITVSVVASAVIAVNDNVSGIDGANGAANVLNVFTGDTVNGAAANSTNAILSLAPGASVPAGLIFDVANGSVSVVAGTPAGTYSFGYQICEALNRANCQIATATVTVINPAPVAVDDATTVVRGQSVKINVLANDSEPGGEALSVTTATAPANGSAVINGDGTISYTPNSSFVGTDSFTYTICDPAGQCSTATVTVTVHPSVSALTGTVFQDMDGNRAKDPTDPRQPNWLVEIVRDGAVVATVRTDANGNYRVSDLPLGAGYSVVFRHPTSNVVYGRTDGVTLNPGITAVDLDRPIDPSGVVYDSVARTAIAGARLTIVNANGALLPVACLLDASQQGQITGADGRYRFDIVPGGAAQCPGSETVYRLVVAGPADTVPGNSTVILPNAGPFDPTGLPNGFVTANIAAPQAGDDTRYFFNFRLASGDPDVVNNHIPLDRAAALNPLVVTKTSVKRTANVGDLVPYTIVVRNMQNIARSAVDIVDLMPAGFKYVANTGRVDANAVSPVANGRELNWQNLNLPANGSLTISLVLTVGSGVNDGDYVNIATGRDARNGKVISNEGQATVRIMPSPLFDCGEIIGKVFDDRNGNGYQDDGESGITGARVATVNGLLITADQHGRYNVTCAAVPNARIGSNFILKLDPRSLPGGYQITTENPRVVRLTRGKISELNFGARVQKAITLELTDAAFETGGTALRAEWMDRLSSLIADVQLQPSTIRLHYAAASVSDALGSDRLKALADQLQLLWREAGEDSELIIERISAPAKPFNGKE